jgi:hypothetical protein
MFHVRAFEARARVLCRVTPKVTRLLTLLTQREGPDYRTVSIMEPDRGDAGEPNGGSLRRLGERDAQGKAL